MSKYVIEIPQEKEELSIWEQRLRVAAYCRVSTKQEEQQGSLKTQIRFYTDYIQSNPNWRFTTVYFDTESGLQTGKRYGYQQLLKDCKKQKIATVYKGNIIKNLIMDCQSYTKYRPNETTGGIFVSWRRKEELPTGA